MKVEINLSETATDEAMAIAVWKAMTRMGRGRAQGLFRQCVIAGLRSMQDRADLPDEILGILRDGVPVEKKKAAWTPRLEEMHIPGLAPVPAKRPDESSSDDLRSSAPVSGTVKDSDVRASKSGSRVTKAPPIPTTDLIPSTSLPIADQGGQADRLPQEVSAALPETDAPLLQKPDQPKAVAPSSSTPTKASKPRILNIMG